MAKSKHKLSIYEAWKEDHNAVIHRDGRPVYFMFISPNKALKNYLVVSITYPSGNSWPMLFSHKGCFDTDEKIDSHLDVMHREDYDRWEKQQRRKSKVNC